MVTRVEERRVVARKEHWCRECGQKIKVGERYVDDVLKEDDVYHWRHHEECREAAFAFDHEFGDVFLPDGRPGLIEDETFIEMVRDQSPCLSAWIERFPVVYQRVQETMKGWKNG